MANQNIDVDMDLGKIKQEPEDINEAATMYFEGDSDQYYENNMEMHQLSSLKTEETVELGAEFISLIKADPEWNSDVNDLPKSNSMEPEMDKLEDRRSFRDNNRSLVHLRKRGAVTNKLSHAKTKCPHCAKMIAFSSISDHVRMVHRPVICDICDKGFSDEVTLKRHKNTVHVDKSSDKRFKWKCDYCDAKYMRKNRLVRHCRNMHKIFL